MTIDATNTTQDTQKKKQLIEYLKSILRRELEKVDLPAEKQRHHALKILERIYLSTNLQLPAHLRNEIFEETLNEIYGYGPIQVYLNDDDVSEIMVNGYDHIYIEKNGKIIKTKATFKDNDHVLQIIERIIAPLGRHIDAGHPTVDARLPDGSRVNAVIPPVAIDGPSITIRKFKREKLSTNKLIEYGSLSSAMVEFLEACVVARLNILIAGGTGSGKTTLLNVLSSFIPPDERIVTIEDAAELQLYQEHVVRLETLPPSVKGEGGVTIRDLVRNALRMRPDRIVVGEVRGGEALDMLQAMNTGHNGSLTTIHANSPRDALSRLETLVMMAGFDLPVKVVRQQIASAIDLVIQQSRLKDGSRRVTQITEIIGMEGDTIILSDIFKFEQTEVGEDHKIIGEHKATGIRPLFMPQIEAAGFKLKPEIFGVNIAEMLAANRNSAHSRR